MRRQNLDGDVAPEPGIVRAVDLAHPAGSKQAVDPIRAERRSGPKR